MPVSAVGTREPMVAWALLAPDGTIRSARSADVVVSAASTIKLAVVFAVLRSADAGLIDLATGLPADRSFRTAAPGHARFAPDPEDADPEFPPDGSIVLIRDLVRWMVERSSNEATNVLTRVVGMPAVDEAAAVAGAVATTMRRFLGDAPAVAVGFDNRTTAIDLARIMRALVGGTLLSPASTAFARDVLAGQRFPRIALELPDGVWWGSKSGDVPGVEHDVAAIGEHDTSVLAVCTRGIGQDAARETIRAVASALRSCFMLV